MNKIIVPHGNLDSHQLANLVDISKDVLQGDMEAALLSDFSQADLIELKKAFSVIANNPNLSDTQVTSLMTESWRMLYYQKPPTIEEFLSPEWLGATSDTIRPHIKDWLCEWYDPEKGYRHCLLSCAIGMGKSYFSVLNSLFVGTNIALMRNPWKTMSSILGEASPIAIIFVSYSIDKVTEILIQPFKQFLLTSPKFRKCKTLESMNKISKESKGTVIPWTTAGETNILTIGNPLSTANVNLKVASDPARLLGLTLVQTIFTELSFFSDKGKSPQYIWRLFQDGRGRILSRFPNQEELKYKDKAGNIFAPTTTFWARDIMDSSPNSWDSPIDKYIYSGEADKNPENLIFRGSAWDIMPDSVPNINDRFPVFIGGASKEPRIIDTQEIKNFATEEVLMVPKFFYNEFYENICKALKDRAGIPSNAQGRLIENVEHIEKMFVSSLRNQYSYIVAPSQNVPERLIWDQIKDDFFIYVKDHYEFYRNNNVPRYISIDQSYKKDTTGISMCHMEQNEHGDIIYIIDFTIAIEPKGSKINLESIKCFVEDLVLLGGIKIVMVSYDHFQSEQSIQGLERINIPTKHLSVDTDMAPYLNMVSLLAQGRVKCGKNIYLKNNLKSLVRAETKIAKKPKIEHTIGEVTDEANIDWDTSSLGMYAKDISDSVSACIALAMRYGEYTDGLWIWKESESKCELKEILVNKALEDLLKQGIRVK